MFSSVSGRVRTVVKDYYDYLESLDVDSFPLTYQSDDLHHMCKLAAMSDSRPSDLVTILPLYGDPCFPRPQ